MRRHPDPRKSDLGRTIVLLANLLDMSQKQLAKKIGMSDQAISDWCRGLSSPSPKAREEVLKALRCTWREIEEVVALIVPLRLELERRRDAKPLDAGWQIKELSSSSLLRLPGSMGSGSSLPDSPGLPGTSTDDKRIWEMGSLLNSLVDLAARAPDRKDKPRR